MDKKTLSITSVRKPVDTDKLASCVPSPIGVSAFPVGVEKDSPMIRTNLEVEQMFRMQFNTPLATEVTKLEGVELESLICRIRDAFPDMPSLQHWIVNAGETEVRGLIQRFQVEMELETDLTENIA